MIGNLSLTPGDTADSISKTLTTQQKSLDFLAKIVLVNKIALYYPLAEQGGVWAVANTIRSTWIDISEENWKLHQITEQTTWFKGVTPSTGSLFDCFGSWGPWLWRPLQTLRIFLLIIIIITSQCTVFSQKYVHSPLTARQIVSLRWEHWKRNEENDLKSVNPELWIVQRLNKNLMPQFTPWVN